MYVENCVDRQKGDRSCGLICLVVMCRESTERVTVEPVGNSKNTFVYEYNKTVTGIKKITTPNKLIKFRI